MSTKERVFEHFPEMLPELQMVIVDEMEPIDRCKFRGCSSLSDAQAKNSKNFMYGLHFHVSQALIFITIFFDRENRGFILTFNNQIGNKYVKCSVRNWQVWIIQMDSSTDMVQYAVQHFKYALKFYQNTIRKLTIDIQHPALETCPIDFEVTRMNNLKELAVDNDVDVQQFLSKTRKRLNFLFTGTTNQTLLGKCDQLYRVQDLVISHHTQLNNEQFLRLSAQCVTIHIGQLTEENISNFIGYWQNGKLGKYVRRYEWNLMDSEFNVKDMFRMFGREHDGFEDKDVEFAHKEEDGKIGRLTFRIYGSLSKVLAFEVRNVNQ